MPGVTSGQRKEDKETCGGMIENRTEEEVGVEEVVQS